MDMDDFGALLIMLVILVVGAWVDEARDGVMRAGILFFLIAAIVVAHFIRPRPVESL
jgi:hypothetical protein